MNKFYTIIMLLLCLTTRQGCLVASNQGSNSPTADTLERASVSTRYATTEPNLTPPQQQQPHHAPPLKPHQSTQVPMHSQHISQQQREAQILIQQQQQQLQLQQQQMLKVAQHYQQHGINPNAPTHAPSLHAAASHGAVAGSGGHVDAGRNSYNLLSEAMSQAVSNEFSSLGSGNSADGACHPEDLDCYGGTVQDHLGMEAIRTLHRQLDDDDNGNIDLSESDDFLREELKYDSGYEKRQKAFHFNDDMHISVKELWEAWLRSEVHNWTIEQTTDWLAQSVQLPQYVDLFKIHKVTGAALPRLAVNNMHYVSNVLGIKDPIHKQKIMLKAMDVVLFGPPRETGTRWKDYILVTLLLSAIIGCWYAYQQNKHAKRHLRRMAQDMEGLQKAEQSLQEMQKELERARMEQENVATEKLDLERRLKEAPTLTSSSSDLEVQQLKKEIEILRTELSRAEIELVDNCWSPPPQLQSWLQYTYELENKNHMKKRISAEKQLQLARESCEKLRKKRSSLVGAFVSTHGKSIDDVDRSIVEARNSLGEVTNELQERMHRWKQIESCLGLSIVNNNGLSYLESVLYGRNGGSLKSRGRMTSSTDELDDDSVQGMLDSYSRMSGVGLMASSSNTMRDDSSGSDEGGDGQSVQFYLGGVPAQAPPQRAIPSHIMSSTNTSSSTPNTPVSLEACNHIDNHLTPAGAITPQCGGVQTAAAHMSFAAAPADRYETTELASMGLHSFSAKQPLVQVQNAVGVLKSGAGALNASHYLNESRAKMVKQHSTASQMSSSSTSSSVQSAPLESIAASSNTDKKTHKSPGRWSSHDAIHEHGMSFDFPSATTASSKAFAEAAHGHTEMEDFANLSSADTKSIDGGSLKKRKHRLRFPGFGKSKSKSTTSSTGSLNDGDKHKHS